MPESVGVVIIMLRSTALGRRSTTSNVPRGSDFDGKRQDGS